MRTQNYLSVRDISKSYGQQKVLDRIHFDLAKNEQCVIQGTSGSGKSTLLYLLAGLDQADSGEIMLDGNDMTKMQDARLSLFRNQNIGLVFQFHFLLPSMNCLDNILLPARIGNASLRKTKEFAKELAINLGVEHCLNKYPYHLSGGEQQRINVIRALSLRPALLLCDEPTGNLDNQNTDKMTTLLKEMALQLNTTLIVVTHDSSVAARFDRKITIEDGRIIG